MENDVNVKTKKPEFQRLLESVRETNNKTKDSIKQIENKLQRLFLFEIMPLEPTSEESNSNNFYAAIVFELKGMENHNEKLFRIEKQLTEMLGE